MALSLRVRLPESWSLIRVFGTAIMSSLALAAFPMSSAFAQDDATEESAADQPIEEIVTTGSRIKRTEFSSASPVQVLTMDMATLGGLADVADILQESTVAANAPQWNNMFSNSVVTGGSGTNAIDLRGLGDGKTLVLLNGRRLNAAGTRGTVSQVDLNTIPTSMIQRVEILKDGASSVYGSDAVAGVVNIITKKNADGISGGFSQNMPLDGGGEITTADMAIGISNEDSSFMFGIDYLERKPLARGEREWARCLEELYFDPDTGEDLSVIDPATGKRKCFDGPANDYIIQFGDFFGGVGGITREIYDPVNANGSSDRANWRVGSGAERKRAHPDSDFFSLLSPVKRVSLFSFGNWDVDGFGANTEAYYEFMYNNRRSSQNTGPRQLGLDVNDSPFSPFWSGGAVGSGISYDVPLLLPYQQTGSQEVNWIRTIAGMTGDLSDNWSWDASVGYGRSHGTYSSTQMLVDRVVNSLDIVEVAPGVWDCAINYDFNAIDAGERGLCVPLNAYDIIANGQNSPGLFPQDVLSYITSVETGETTFNQKMVSGYLTGSLFEMPAGTVGAVIGAELRRESINDTPSSGSINGNLWGFTSSGITKGEDTVKEVFAEIELPLLSGAPGAEELVFSAAARYSTYDTAGSDTTYRVGLNWQIVDQLRLRSSFGTSFRAPSLYESFLGGQTGFSRAGDPCEEFGTEEDPSSNVYQNCLAETGNVDFPGYNSTPRVITFGNAGRLVPETSESLSVGLIMQLEVIDLAVAVDYFDFEIKDEINQYGTASILNLCYGLVPDRFRQPGTICDFITERKPDGNIEEVNDSYFNINEKNQDGIDLTVRYSFEIGSVDFTADLRATKIRDFTQNLFGDEATVINGQTGYPDENGQLDLRADYKDWTFYYGLDYIGPQEDYTINGIDPATSIYILNVPSIVYHDISVRYNGDGWTAQLGVQNVADKEPPKVSDVIAGFAGNAAYNTGYDFRGRTAFFGLSKDF